MLLDQKVYEDKNLKANPLVFLCINRGNQRVEALLSLRGLGVEYAVVLGFHQVHGETFFGVGGYSATR